MRISREMLAVIHLCSFDERFWEQARQALQVIDSQGRHHEKINWKFFSSIDFGGVGEGIKSWSWCLYTSENVTPEVKEELGFADPFDRLFIFSPREVLRLNEAIMITTSADELPLQKQKKIYERFNLEWQGKVLEGER